ncbi:MAG: hypothetical protein RLZZ09_104, partial [Pseudomonadota bacterium]
QLQTVIELPATVRARHLTVLDVGQGATTPPAVALFRAVRTGVNKRLRPIPPRAQGRLVYLITCTVELDPQKTGEATRARDGQLLDVNSPVKYVTDPQSGQQLPILPGTNVQVANGVTTLLHVPIQYMDCGAYAFEVNDHVLVEFTDRDWSQPRVIGFAENPKPCSRVGLILTGIPSTTGVREGLFLRDVPKGGDGKLVHPSSGGVTQGGNLDWISADRKTTLTFKGPPGRSIAPTIMPGSYHPYDDFAQDGLWRHRFRMKFGADTAQHAHPDGAMFIRTFCFGYAIYLNGKTEVTAPPRHFVLGAGVCRYEGPDNAGQPVTKSYLVAVFGGNLYLDWADHEEQLQCWDVVTRPEMINPVFAYATLDGTTVGPWQILHTELLHERGNVMPPINAVFFSENGTQCVTCIPTLSQGLTTYTNDDGSYDAVSYQVGNDLILRARFIPGLNGVTLEPPSREYQTNQFSQYFSGHSKTGPSDRDYGSWSFDGSSSESVSSAAIMAIDYVGEQEVTLTVTASKQSTSINSGAGHSVEGSIHGDHGDINSSANSRWAFSITDTHREKTVGHYLSLYDTRSSESWSGTDQDGNAALPWAVSLATTRDGVILRPYYYDLRSGAGVWYSASGSSQYNQGHSGDLTQGPQVWSGNQGGQLSAHFEDRDAKQYGQNATSYADALGGAVNDTPTLQGSGVSGSWSSSQSGNPAPESGCNLARAQHLTRWEPGSWGYAAIEVLPILYTQPCNATGDIVCRIDFRAYPKVDSTLDAVHWSTNGAIDFDRLHHYDVAFSTAFDLDAAWMNHLATYHQPADGSGVPLQTAVEGGLVPEFRR